MKTKDWALVVGSFIFTLVIDQVTKIWSVGLQEFWIGPLHFIYIQNHGAMLGMFANLPAFLRIVTLSTSGFFLLSIYFFLQYIIPIRIIVLRVGLSLLIGGIVGNVVDRTLYGYVIDFVGVKLGNFHSPIWNLADTIQWVGYALILYSIYKDGHLLWPDINARRTFWVNKKFQVKYAFIFIITGLCLTLISLVFSYTYLRITLTELMGNNIEAVEKFTQAYLYSFLILVLAFSVALFAVAKIISHRIAGPIYAFERYLNEVLEGKGLTKNGKALKLRAGDDFRHLEILAEKVREKIVIWNAEKKIEVVEFSDEPTVTVSGVTADPDKKD